jgi:hypothetical protein
VEEPRVSDNSVMSHRRRRPSGRPEAMNVSAKFLRRQIKTVGNQREDYSVVCTEVSFEGALEAPLQRVVMCDASRVLIHMVESGHSPFGGCVV